MLHIFLLSIENKNNEVIAACRQKAWHTRVLWISL